MERTTDLADLAQDFPPGGDVPKNRGAHEIKSPDIRALALLLFGLKYLYGLDDASEEALSESARRTNRDTEEDGGGKRKFVICDWIRLSRARLFLAARHCPAIREQVPIFQTLYKLVTSHYLSLAVSLWSVRRRL